MGERKKERGENGKWYKKKWYELCQKAVQKVKKMKKKVMMMMMMAVMCEQH